MKAGKGSDGCPEDTLDGNQQIGKRTFIWEDATNVRTNTLPKVRVNSREKIPELIKDFLKCPSLKSPIEGR